MAYNDSPELALALPALSTITLDSAAGGSQLYTKKVVILVVTTLLTWVTSGQPTWRLFGSRAAFAAAGGATSQLTAGQTYLGAAQNLGAAAQTSLPVGSYYLDPTTLAQLQWPYPLVGMELVFPSALTAGVASLFLETGP